MVPTFVPGITRPDIYCPVLESFPIFELAFQLHSNHIVNHFDFVQSCMLFRYQFTNMFYEHVKIENNTIDCIFKSKCTYRDVPSNVKSRVKRKLRFSVSNLIKDIDFLNFLTKKGHAKWCLLE